MNILLTSVGRRAYLVRYFKEALAGRGKVFAINSDLQSPGMHEADICFLAPPIDSIKYIDFVCDVIEKNEIKLALSLFDIDLSYLAYHKERFELLGVKLIVSEPDVISTANDKWLTYKFCKENNLATPETYLNLEKVEYALESGLIDFPLIVKPRWGMGSLSVFKANDSDELRFYYMLIKKQIMASYLKILSTQELDEAIIIQACIKGTEFGLDIFNDLNRRPIQTIVKKKIAMRSGETDIAEVLPGHFLESTGNNIAKKLKHIGNLDVDIIISDSGHPYIIEFNARFGGGYPFSHLAGADFPRKLIEMVENPSNPINISQITPLKAYKDITPRAL